MELIKTLKNPKVKKKCQKNKKNIFYHILFYIYFNYFHLYIISNIIHY